MRIGAHVDQSDAVALALAMGAGQAQVFLGDPQSWKGPAFDFPGGADALRATAADADVDLVVHAPYVINVASTNNRIRIPSRKLLQKIMDGAAAIGAKGVVVHGGHVGKDDEPEVGFDNWRKAVEALTTDVPVLIENTAGGDGAMARGLDRIAQLWEAVAPAGRKAGVDVGLCLDSCHAWASGIDLTTAVADVRAITGRIDLVHANNSRDAAGSGADRHAGLTDGTIDPDVLVALVRDAGAPVICETHADAPRDVAWLTEQLGVEAGIDADAGPTGA
ncbi:deoxyribonuclease IV [Luteimicrobium subarcticum]|uniref:Endonuclease IV n=1 Tax=Luteimicrobium subarcticum TaxID=620910 RepID=A0A2M8W6V9_9MICO|nr:deoxyribonuclease IV [Luteimicrobium subarcticum]PJI86667.1 endonuclease IV [Luteimicrobium subarcticum]